MKKKGLIDNNLKFNNFIFPLYHVGTMDISKKSKDSYEGNGLSVSMCPSAWESIARICNYNVWKLEKENINLLDYYKVPTYIRENITLWGIENGYLEEVFGRYFYCYYDEELGRDIATLCSCFEEALEEACLDNLYETYDDFINSKDGDKDMIYPVKSYRATEKLKSLSLIDISEEDSVEQNFILYIENNTNYDGIYWDETLDILSLSAPRGVIFNSKLSSFSKELISESGADYIENQLWESEIQDY